MINQLARFLFLFSLLITSSQVSNAAGFQNVIIFGDSISDTDNLLAIARQEPVCRIIEKCKLPKPFYKNRASDGPVAVEVLNGLLTGGSVTGYYADNAQGTNFAIMGAMIRGNRTFQEWVEALATESNVDLSELSKRQVDLSTQVTDFIDSTGGTVPADPLIVIAIGGNDVLEARKMPDATAIDELNEALVLLKNNIERLAVVGAKDFLVVNLPNISAMPKILGDTDAMKLKVDMLTSHFNAELSAIIADLGTQPDLTIAEFDLYGYTKDLANSASGYGISILEFGCLKEYNAFKLIRFGIFECHAECGDNAEHMGEFYYFDHLHFTGKVHSLIGTSMYNHVNASFP